MITLGKTVVKYHNQEINIETIHWSHSGFSFDLYPLLCVSHVYEHNLDPVFPLLGISPLEIIAYCHWVKFGSTKCGIDTHCVYWHCIVMKECIVFITEYQARRMGSSCSNDPNSPMAFREGVLKAVWVRELQVVWWACVLGLVGIMMTFQGSPTFGFWPVWGLHACGHQFSSGGGLLPLKITYACVSELCIF